MLKEQQVFSIWSDSQATIMVTDTAKDIDLAGIVPILRRKSGINITDRHYHLTNYENCFCGNEAAQWFRKTCHLSKEDATIMLGRRLIDEQWIYHVNIEPLLEYEPLLYRFYLDEKMNPSRVPAHILKILI